jgi:hypothetical protein
MKRLALDRGVEAFVFYGKISMSHSYPLTQRRIDHDEAVMDQSAGEGRA